MLVFARNKTKAQQQTVKDRKESTSMCHLKSFFSYNLPARSVTYTTVYCYYKKANSKKTHAYVYHNIRFIQAVSE